MVESREHRGHGGGVNLLPLWFKQACMSKIKQSNMGSKDMGIYIKILHCT